MIDSIDTVIYTAYFLIPGYIISEIIRQFMPDRERNEVEKAIKCLGYSILELALWYWLFNIIFKKYGQINYKYWLFLIFAVLVTSIITGVLIGVVKQGLLLRKILSFFGVQTGHPVPTGWDYVFYNTKTEKWVCICLDNGTFVRGKFGVNSLASSEKDNHDIYLEEVYRKQEDGEWYKEDRTAGIWISASSIKWINFYKNEEVSEDGEQ